MAMNNSLCLITAMDNLWYHQIILWSDPISSLSFESLIQPFTKFSSCPSSSSTLPFPPHLSHEEIPSSSSADTSVHSQEDCGSDENKEEEEDRIGSKTLLTRKLNFSSSFSTQKTSKKQRFSVGLKLSKSKSCKSLGELELEEIKGFMDLGFVFKEENLSSQMVNLLPGLERFRIQRKTEEKEEREISRPYLSEAWTVKRPNSPLLNLRVAKISSTTDMKKHLKFWAKTVASEILQES